MYSYLAANNKYTIHNGLHTQITTNHPVFTQKRQCKAAHSHYHSNWRWKHCPLFHSPQAYSRHWRKWHVLTQQSFSVCLRNPLSSALSQKAFRHHWNFYMYALIVGTTSTANVPSLRQKTYPLQQQHPNQPNAASTCTSACGHFFPMRTSSKSFPCICTNSSLKVRIQLHSV